MIDVWLTAIEDLILNAPGNADSQVGEIWESTLQRLGESSVEVAREHRVHWDYPEEDDVAATRPFFVLTEAELDWREYNYDDLAAGGVIELAYAEQTWTQATTHRDAKLYFVQWTSQLIQYLAEQAKQGTLPIHTIKQTVFAQRTPQRLRDPDRPDTDYIWAAWEIGVGFRDGKGRRF